jgi:hypothetical protein
MREPDLRRIASFLMGLTQTLLLERALLPNLRSIVRLLRAKLRATRLYVRPPLSCVRMTRKTLKLQNCCLFDRRVG